MFLSFLNFILQSFRLAFTNQVFIIMFGLVVFNIVVIVFFKMFNRG